MLWRYVSVNRNVATRHPSPTTQLPRLVVSVLELLVKDTRDYRNLLSSIIIEFISPEPAAHTTLGARNGLHVWSFLDVKSNIENAS